MKDVEIVIIMMSTGSYFMPFTTRDFFNYMFNENLAEKCQYVVLRITNPEESRSSRRQSNPQEKKDPESIMRIHGLEKEEIKAKVCKLIVYLIIVLNFEKYSVYSIRFCSFCICIHCYHGNSYHC